MPKKDPTIKLVLTSESDDDRTARRAQALQALTATHLEMVCEAHDKWPTPQKKFAEMSEEEQNNWNFKRVHIDTVNRAYFLDVQRICADHRVEDFHLARLHREASDKAQETAQ